MPSIHDQCAPGVQSPVATALAALAAALQENGEMRAPAPVATPIEVPRVTLTTEEAAAALHLRPQTLRKWACLEAGPLRPVRVNRRLHWPAAAINRLLAGESA